MPLPQSLCRWRIHGIRFAYGVCSLAVILLASFGVALGQEGREGAVPEQLAQAQKDRVRRGPLRSEQEKPRSEQDKAKATEKPGAANTESRQAKPQESSKVAQPAPPPPSAPVDKQLERTADGKFRFSFQGQPWLEVLQWLARNSKLTLDWQELPEDRLNLTTQSSYTLDEARDLFNMHLAARGYTLLRRGEVLGLVKLDKLNPALVPRVEPGELDSRDRHEIVRVSFPLEWLVAEAAVKEFDPMKSPFGKLTAMAATNRMEALDTVENLLQIRELVQREQSPQGEERLVVEFKLKHVRAEDIMSKLQTLVGSPGALLRPQDRARMQMMRMRESQNEDKNRNENAKAPAKQEPQVHLVVNEQENSILANAPPDKLAVVRQAVQALDVPPSAGSRGSDAATRMRIYRTKGIDPEPMADLIQELVGLGKLASSTQVQADDNSNTLIVYATPADHMAIANLVDQIGDTGRDVRIIVLRQLTPDYALQAIKLLLKGEQPDSSAGGFGGGEGGRWRRRGGGGGGGSAGGDEQFRIEADAERNRLLLWATDMEYEQVKAMLAKLGEEGGSAGMARGNLRILNMPSRGSQQALESLQQIWPHLRTNPLQIRGLENTSEPKSQRATESSSTKQGDNSPENRTTSSGRSGAIQRITPAVLPAAIALAAAGADASTDSASPRADNSEMLLAQVGKEAQTAKPESQRVEGSVEKEDGAEEDASPSLADKIKASPRADEDAAKSTDRGGGARRVVRPAERIARADASEPPSITITQGPGGQLIVTSEDVEALDAVEKLIAQIMPRQADYEVFRLRHASPYAIELTLSQIFGVVSPTDYGGRSGMPMATRSALQFISNVDTGTLLVQGATAEQLQKIAALIEMYDQPETQHEDLQRKTEIYEVKYSRADSVAEVVKEVYRDLLSVNDKAFTRERTNENGRSASTLGYGTNYATRIPQFRGLLSIGVEQQSNTLVVSAPVYLVGDVMSMIRAVDERSASHKPRVVQLNVGAAALRSALTQIPGVTVNAPAAPSASSNAQQAPSFQASSRSPPPGRDNGEANFSMPARGDFRSRTGVGNSRFENNPPPRRGEGGPTRRGERD